MAFSTCDMWTSSPQPCAMCPCSNMMLFHPCQKGSSYKNMLLLDSFAKLHVHCQAAAEVLWQAAPAEAATSSATFIASIFRESKTELLYQVQSRKRCTLSSSHLVTCALSEFVFVANRQALSLHTSHHHRSSTASCDSQRVLDSLFAHESGLGV